MSFRCIRYSGLITLCCSKNVIIAVIVAAGIGVAHIQHCSISVFFCWMSMPRLASTKEDAVSLQCSMPQIYKFYSFFFHVTLLFYYFATTKFPIALLTAGQQEEGREAFMEC